MSDSFVTPWTIACEASLSMEFSRQEYWSRLPFPSPGMGIIHQCKIKVKVSESRSVVSNSLGPHGSYPTRFLYLWNFPGKNTGVGCHSLLQGIFLSQEVNLGLLHFRQILYHLSHQGSQLSFTDMQYQSWIFIGRTDAEAQSPIFWPPDAKSWLTRKDPDAGKDWRQEEKGTTENEAVGWHRRLNGHEFEQAPGVGDGQGSLSCCSPWGHKELDMTERLNWTETCNI